MHFQIRHSALCPRTLFVALVAFVAAFVAACSKPPTGGKPVAFDDVARRTGAQKPLICSKLGDGNEYSVEGYPHWPEQDLCKDDDCYVEIHRANNANGTPAKPVATDANLGFVRLDVKKKGLFGGMVDEPKLAGESVSTSGVASGKTTTHSGSLVPDSLSLHLSDGTTVNNRVRIRAYFKVEERAPGSGACWLTYLGGVRI